MLKPRTKKIISLIAVIGLLIFLHVTKIIKPVETLIINILNPIFSGFYSISSDLRSTYNDQTDKRDLAEINKEIEKKNNELTVENTRLKVLEEENKVLREHLKFLVKAEYNYIMANIISRGILDDSNQSVIINRGSRDGLYSGLAIISSQGIIIGKITEARDNISEICLITSSQCRLAATVLNNDKTSGIAQGDLGLTIKVDFIPQTEEINIDDTIITSGLEQDIPRGLVIGRVTEVNKESNKLWQNAIIEPLVDLDELNIVSVLLP